jgi:gamma-glutamyltranspeptidase/glutathione hydrolase
MVSAANPHAVDAAIEILKKGGSAVDAAIAAHAVLGLVEPQSSGLGGGGFMLNYNFKDGDLTFIDGRETAPSKATIDMFMKDGNVMGFREAWVSGKAVGSPGAVALYKAAHERSGKIPWSDLFEYAINLAENGFEVSPRLAGFVKALKSYGRLSINEGSRDYFYPNDIPLKKGDILKNKEYATTLKKISKDGIKGFYEGSIAQSIVESASREPNPGSLDLNDLKNYKTVIRPVICGSFRDLSICTTSPPSSGGAQIMIAGIYDNLATENMKQHKKIQAFVDAQRLSYADRDHYFGDPDEVEIPIDALLNPDYLRRRSEEKFNPSATPVPGDPSRFIGINEVVPNWGADNTEEASGTTHISIIDFEGNAVSMTATIESVFGSHRWASGFLLNNEMTDFSRKVPDDGTKIANAVAPNRRPRSSMSPTMIFDKHNNLLMITGSPGGNSIPAYVSKTILGVFAWGLSAQEAVDLPNIVARGEKVKIESSRKGKKIKRLLKKKGYNVTDFGRNEVSGLHLITVLPSKLDGAFDKRREGKVVYLNEK